MKPRPPSVLVCSESEPTRLLLGSLLSGFRVYTVSSKSEAENYLRHIDAVQALDFLIFDGQSEASADELARYLRSLTYSSLSDTKIIHLYTPTTDSLSGQALFSSSIAGVIRMTKPPRKARLLQTLASLKDRATSITSTTPSAISQAIEDISAAQRTLFGNVLIAEGICPSALASFSTLTVVLDNDIARQLLIKQLQRYQLNVTSATNGAEAIQRAYYLPSAESAINVHLQTGNPMNLVTSVWPCLIIVSAYLSSVRLLPLILC